ncbi:hypothetical protein ES703_30001 [subsurface metagenome]
MDAKTLEGLKVKVNEDYVLKLQRCGRKPGGRIKEILVCEVEEAYRLAQPRATWAELIVEEINDSVVKLQGGFVLHAGDVAKEWRGSRLLAVAVATIGSALEEGVDELFAQRDFARAMMLDSIGSAAVESIANDVNYAICQRAAALGLNRSPRSSPGYGKWNLTDQRFLLGATHAYRIGTRLNEQYMMIPRKSVSFAIGIGSIMVGAEDATPCRRCGREGCEYRR